MIVSESSEAHKDKLGDDPIVKKYVRSVPGARHVGHLSYGLLPDTMMMVDDGDRCDERPTPLSPLHADAKKDMTDQQHASRFP